jgi:hypothetical protein
MVQGRQQRSAKFRAIFSGYSWSTPCWPLAQQMANYGLGVFPIALMVEVGQTCSFVN